MRMRKAISVRQGLALDNFSSYNRLVLSFLKIEKTHLKFLSTLFLVNFNNFKISLCFVFYSLKSIFSNM